MKSETLKESAAEVQFLHGGSEGQSPNAHGDFFRGPLNKGAPLWGVTSSLCGFNV